MVKNILVLLSLIILLAIPSSSYAETEAALPTTATETSTTPTTKPIKAARIEAKNAMKEAVAEAKDALKEKMSEAREEFKEKLAAIKDQRKMNVLTNLDARIQDINKKRTTEMSARIERLTKILATITEKTTALKSQGKDTEALESNIDEATEALEEAKAAVDAQAAKDYVVDVTTETALRTAASTTVKTFTADIKAVHKLVVDAQLAIKETYKDLGLLMGEKSSVTPSVTATP